MVSQLSTEPVTAGNCMLYDEARTKGSIDRALESIERVSASVRHLIATIFRTSVSGDVMVVGVAAKKWCKGTTHSKAKPHYHRTAQ